MKQHEREYFISRIRSGILFIKEPGISLKIVTPTILEEYQINETYNQSYVNAINDGIKTEKEITEWMIEKELWTDDDENKLNGIKKDIDKLKIEIFNSRNNHSLVQKIRLYLREAEKHLIKQINKKNLFYENTCESIASLDRSFHYLKLCTYLNDKLYDFELYSLEYILHKYYSLMLPEPQLRELARNEPWKTLWILNGSNVFKLFDNFERQLSIDQRNLLIWSKMYDNIQESVDCPSEDVINDDDMLDGWFLLQKNKRDKEKAQREFEETNTNSKIKNADEVFIMANSKEDFARIDNMNDIHQKMIKKQRFETIKKKGEASQLDFQDEKLKLAQVSNTMFRDKFRR